MPIYWSMLVVAALIGIISPYIKPTKLNSMYGTEYRTNIALAVFFFAYIAFFCTFRDKVLDTGAYIQSFNSAPSSWAEIMDYVNEKETGQGFYLIQALFKTLISEDHYMWFGFLSVITCASLFWATYKNSDNFPFTAFLFIATTEFTWLFNGTRQFLAVSVLFAFSDWLIEGKKWRYILIALIMSTIHNSAIFVVPVCLFVSSKKIWDKKMFAFIILTIIGTVFSEQTFEFASMVTDTNYTDSLEEGTGSNIIRLFVALVPVVIILFTTKVVKREADSKITLAANISMVNACFYFTSTFTDGILIGRMPIYFSVYNLYLIPWLLKHCFTKASGKIITIICIALYIIYFYYQMVVIGLGDIYVSDILGIRYYH